MPLATFAGAEGCKGANVLWQFHDNGTVTTSIDGACLNAAHGG